MTKLIQLTSTDSSIDNLNIRMEDISSVYRKQTAGGKWTVVSVGPLTYFVRESVEFILSKLNRGWL